MKIKTLLVCALAIAAFADARAQSITFAGTTTGTFSATGTNVNQGLTFTNGTFNETTSGGFAAIGSSAPGNNFGTFTLAPGNSTFSGSFTLNITFTSPAGVNPNPGIFTATVTGSVTGSDGGAAIISFLPSPRDFTFNGGSFQLFVDNTSVSPGSTAPITGRILAVTAAVPEGGTTVALLGLSLVAVAAARKKFGIA